MVPASWCSDGDAKIIKNAGAIVAHPFGSVMRSVIVALYELNATVREAGRCRQGCTAPLAHASSARAGGVCRRPQRLWHVDNRPRAHGRAHAGRGRRDPAHTRDARVREGGKGRHLKAGAPVLSASQIRWHRRARVAARVSRRPGGREQQRPRDRAPPAPPCLG